MNMKEIKSLYGDSYEVTNEQESIKQEESGSFCGDCFKCYKLQQMCETGIQMVSAYTDFKGA